MRTSRLLESLSVLGMAIVLAGAARAGTQTYVALAGRDDSLFKLGRPGIQLRVDASSADDAGLVTVELARELVQQVHTRRLAPDEAGDYDLMVKLEAPRIDASVTTVRFEAVLTSAQGERLWRIEGRSDVVGETLDASVFAGIGRNVVSALIHDGWLQPRYDPDDPPPQPPRIRND
jgi:hypothetical protein